MNMDAIKEPGSHCLHALCCQSDHETSKVGLPRAGPPGCRKSSASGLFSPQADNKTSAARIKLPRRTGTETLLVLPPLATQLFLRTNGKNTLCCGTIAYGAENSEVLPEPSIDVAVTLGPVSGPPT